MHTTHIAVDTSKTVFTLHASDAIGHCTGRLDLKRAKFLAYFEKQPSLTVTVEACGGSHHWGRELTRLGHVVRLIAPQGGGGVRGRPLAVRTSGHSFRNAGTLMIPDH